MKKIDELTLKVISDIAACQDEYNDVKDVVNQIYGVLLFHEAVKGDKVRAEK